MHFRTLRDNSGGVLISALLIVSLVASIVMLLFSQAMGMQRQMFNQSIRLQAYYAHLGIEQMVAHQLQKLWADSPSDFFLFDESLKLVYRGQIDDSRPGNGISVNAKDLKHAMDCLLQKKVNTWPQKPSIGCNIKWK